MIKLKFLGCGSAFTTSEYYNSMLLLQKGNKNFLIDCGGDVRFAANEAGLKANDIDSFAITHAHVDHCGGLEWLGFCTHFSTGIRPKFYTTEKQVKTIWEDTLKGGFGKSSSLETFFQPIVDAAYGNLWERTAICHMPTKHCMDGEEWMESYSIIFQDLESTKKPIWFTGDMIFDKVLVESMADSMSVIFHDCETTPYKSGVHAHYDELVTLPKEVKNKMWLYHYQPNPTQNPLEDGFLGFVGKGQEFVF